MRIHVLTSISFGLVTALSSLSVSAHGIWFAERSSQTAIVYGHGAEDSDPIRRFDKFRTITALDGKGAPLSAAWKKTDYLVLADAPKEAAVITGTLDNGYWTKGMDDKWVAKGRDEVPTFKESGRYWKFTTYIKGDLDKPLAPIEGHRLQIVPVAAKLPHHKDQWMTVRVLFDGKPVSGASFIRDYTGDPEAKPVKTNKDGTVKFQVRNQGLNVLAAKFDAPADDPAKATKTSLFATLSFAIKHGPE
jgi:nickel transport protein